MTKTRLLMTVFLCLVLLSIVPGTHLLAQDEAAPEATAEVVPEVSPAAPPTEEPTAVPTEEPTAQPTEEAPVVPTVEATPEPTSEATSEPTAEPTAEVTTPPTPEVEGTPAPLADLFQDDFQNGINANWLLSAGWQMGSEGDNHFLQTSSADDSATVTGLDWPNLLFAGSFRIPKGSAAHVDFGGGYTLTIRPSGKARLYRAGTLLAEGAAVQSASEWRQVNLQALGGLFTVAVDRAIQFSVTDPAPLAGGSLSIRSGGALAFDNIVVNRLDTPTPLPAEEATPEVAIAQAPPVVRDPAIGDETIFVVNTPSDLSDPVNVIQVNPGDEWCTLREAMLAANDTSDLLLFPECSDAPGTSIPGEPDHIHFAITDVVTWGSGPYEIIPIACTLPLISDPVVIDGYTQPDSAVAGVNPAVIRIELNGDNSTGGSSCPNGGSGNNNTAHGIHVQTGGAGTTIKGLAITRFRAAGIYLDGTSDVTISGNYIGLENGGSVTQTNAGGGVRINNSTNNLIGGYNAADRNLISGNTTYGVRIMGSSSENTVVGNYIGVDRTGLSARPNTQDGVFIESGTLNFVGNTNPGARNVISGNGGSGVHFRSVNSSTFENIIQGNYIGLAYDGSVAIPNGLDGIRLAGSAGNLIGGNSAAARNVISGNTQYGLHLIAQGGLIAGFNTVQNNYIGTTINGNGTVPIPTGTGNGFGGIYLEAGSFNTIGGTAANTGNVIAGNLPTTGSNGYGIYITNNSTGNLIHANYIGIGANGTTPLPNRVGIRISGPSQTFIGTTNPLTRNIISGNASNGLEIIGVSTTDTRILGNYIGVAVDGMTARANGGHGIYIQSAVNSVIGSTDAGATNVISGNTGDGIHITGTGEDLAETNRIQNNYIGVAADSLTSLGNGGHGVNILSFTRRNQVGTDPASVNPDADIGGNIIANNALAGVSVGQAGGVGNSIMKNVIYNNGGLGVDLGADGVSQNDGSDADSGPNHLQNFPVVTAVSRSGGEIEISGQLNTTPNVGFTPELAYRIDFFNNQTCDPSKYGEGRTYLASLNFGSEDIDTILAADGIYTFNITVDDPGSGFITMTATERRPNGTDFDYSTSEFSQCLDPNNNPPSITPLPIDDVTTAHNTLSEHINFTINDVETSAASLQLMAVSSNTGIVSNDAANFIFEGSGNNRTLRVHPNSGASAFGTTVITIFVTDAGGASSSTYFLLHVLPPNDPPTIGNIAPQFTEPNVDTPTIDLVLSDPDGDVNNVMLDFSSSNTSIVSNDSANFNVTGTGANRQLVITPLGALGTTTITVTATDAGGAQATRQFPLTVGINTPPTINTSISTESVAYHATNQYRDVNFNIGDAESPLTSLVITATSSEEAVAPNAGLIVTTPNPNNQAAKRLRINFTPDAADWTIITLTVTDPFGASTTVTFGAGFRANGNGANPNLTGAANKTTDMNVPVAPYEITVSDSGAGATPVAGIIVKDYFSDNPALIGNIAFNPGSAADKREVIITPAVGQSGTARITFIVDDGSGGIRGVSFNLTVNAPNQAPVISQVADQFTTPGASTGPIAFTITDDVALSLGTVSRLSSNTTLLPVNNIVVSPQSGNNANRTVTLNPVAGQTGTAVVTLSVTDNGDPKLTGTMSFTLTVSSNSAPTISNIANRTTTEGLATGPIAFTISDEAPTTVTFTTTSSDQTLVPNANLVLGGSGTNRTINVTPANGQLGTSTITVTVRDAQGLEASDTFVLTVVPNSAPFITSLDDKYIQPHPKVTDIKFFVGDGQTPNQLNVTVTSSNTTLLPNNGIAVSGNNSQRTMALSPASGQTGVTTITITVEDPAGASAVYEFDVHVFPQSPPVLKSPKDGSGVVKTRPSFSWKKVKTAKQYELQVATDEAFTNIVVTYTGKKPKYAMPKKGPALDYGTYFWRVRALNAGGSPISDWSAVADFDLSLMKSPKNGSFSKKNTLAFKWQKAGKNMTYTLLVDDDPLFGSPISDFCAKPTSTSCKLKKNNALAPGVYYWRVDVNGVPSSVVWQFTVTGPTAGATKLTAPRNNAKVNGSTTALSWKAAANAQYYEIEIASDKAFKNVVYRDSSVNGTSISLPMSLPKSSFFWRVRAFNSQNAPGKWSAKWKFNIQG